MSSTRSSRPPGPFARFFFGRIFPLIFLVSGLAVLVFGSTNFIRGKQSETWPQTSGRILSSKVESHSGSKGGTTYSAAVAYTYEVGNTRFVSKKISFGDYGSSDSSHAGDIVRRYPENKTVVVRYDPAEPSRAVIETGINGGIFIPVAVGAVFAIAGLTMAIFLPRTLRKQDENRRNATDALAPNSLRGREGNENSREIDVSGLPDSHPKITRNAGLDAVVFTTRAAGTIGIILLLVAVFQIAIVATFFREQPGSFVPVIFLVGDIVMIAVGLFLLRSRHTLSISASEVAIASGTGRLAWTRRLRRTPDMSVRLEHRGSVRNGRNLDAIVVANDAGEEIHFGDFLDDSRKNFLAGHLVKLMKTGKRRGANPFVS